MILCEFSLMYGTHKSPFCEVIEVLKSGSKTTSHISAKP